MKALMTVLSSLDPISFYSQCNLFWSLPRRQFRVTFFLFVYAVSSFCQALREPAKVRLCMLSRAACPCSLALRTARNPDVSRAFGALPEHCFVPGIYYYAQTMLKKNDIAPKPAVVRVWSNVFICIGCFLPVRGGFSGARGCSLAVGFILLFSGCHRCSRLSDFRLSFVSWRRQRWGRRGFEAGVFGPGPHSPRGEVFGGKGSSGAAFSI